MGGMSVRRVTLFLSCLLLAVASADARELRRYDTPFYVLHSDLPEELAREAATRMTALAIEYSARTSGFSGKSPRGMDFYLFSDQQGYAQMGGLPGSGGVFQSRWRGDTFVDGRLMAFVHGDSYAARKSTWQTIQHEGFHQFSALAIGGRKPPWIEEGFAEVFGYAEYTGDSFVSGVSPEREVRRIKALISEDKVVPLEQMMFIDKDEWNARLDADLYLQAWSMAYFLLHGEGGRYMRPTEQFMARLGRGQNWTDAFVACFGQPHGFQEAWAAWWTEQPDDRSRLDYLAATLRKLTSFAARAEAAGSGFDTFEDVRRAAELPEPPMPASAWLPKGLLDEAIAEADAVAARDGGTWSIDLADAPQPKVRRFGQRAPEQVRSVVYRASDGTTYRGTYELGRNAIEAIHIAAEPAD